MGGRRDGFAWKAINNTPLLRGRATAGQVASLSRRKRTAQINCRSLHLNGATGVPNGKTRSYTFNGTCSLYHTRSGSQGLQVTQVLVSGNWEFPQAMEGVAVLTDSGKGGGNWRTTYTCDKDPWIHRDAQCSRTMKLGHSAPPVYDPITDLIALHPVALGMAKLSQAENLSKTQAENLSKTQAEKLAREHAAKLVREHAAKLANQPKTLIPLNQMGMVVSRSSHPPSLAKPKLTIRFALASASPANKCDPNRLVKMNVVIRNEGGPLLAHTRFAYVHAAESGGAYLVSRHVSLPAIPTQKTWRGVLVVGTRKSFFPKLPGQHTLVVSIGPDHAAPGTLAYTPPLPSRVPVNIPSGYCQPPRKLNIGTLRRGAALGAIHATTRGKPTVGLRHGMQQRGVRKKLTPVTPALRLAPATPVRRMNPKKKLSPSVAHPKIKLSPPTMHLMQLPARR